jgi:hypothetical protein
VALSSKADCACANPPCGLIVEIRAAPGIPNATVAQIDLAARGAAWGDAIGVALVNNLGLLNGQAINFLEAAAQGIAVYSASLASQPTAAPFQGAALGHGADAANAVQVTGVAAHVDHVVM